MTEEEKHKLIELSDLNREDNIKYISSEAQGIAITLDSDKYAPTFCKLERAYICGRRKSEKRIEELEGLLINSKRLSDEIERAQRKQIAELKEENNKLLDVINNQDVKIADLEKMLSEQYPDLKQSLDWANKRENENVERLKQAKEIIRTFLNMPMPNNEEVFADVGMFLTKAEQFLKEIEK